MVKSHPRNDVDLPKEEWDALPAEQQERMRERAYERMHQGGAHYVVDGIWDVPPILDEINARLARGERP